MDIWYILVPLLLIKLILIFFASPPTIVAEWIVGRYTLHPRLKEENVTVTVNEIQWDNEEKAQIINYFNKETYLKRYLDIPEKSGIPVILDAKIGKVIIRFSLYIYETRVDVIKEYKNKVFAYCLSSKNFPEFGDLSDTSVNA